MSEQVTLDAEFLRRALNQGLDGSSDGVVVTPGALPPDFPLILPEGVGGRVLGGVRSAALQQTLSPSGSLTERRMWRVFLDVPGPPPEVTRALTSFLLEQGWQTGHMWRHAFVETAASEWMGVHAGQERMLTFHTRAGEGVTSVALTVHDVDAEQLQHLLGQHPHAHFHAMRQLPLPTLAAPPGWRVQMQGGSAGETERSERAGLLPLEGEEADAADLLAHFRPQLEGQGWNVLHVGNGPGALFLTARTERGVGVLTLHRQGSALQACLLHVAPLPGGQEALNFYTLSSGG